MKAGYGFCQITPGEVVPMAGFDRRSAPSEGILDPLGVSALALCGEQGEPFFLCAFDLLGTDAALCAAVRQAIHLRLGVGLDRTWVCATHTHAGPGGIFEDKGGFDPVYARLLAEQAAQAAARAAEAWGDARCFTASAAVEGVASRRNRGRAGAACPMPAHLVRFALEGEEVYLYRFACHPTVLDEKNRRFSRDLPGACAVAMGLPCLFVNGPCADRSTRYTRRASNPEELARLGKRMAGVLPGAPWAAHPPAAGILMAERRITLVPAALPEGPARAALASAWARRRDACADPEEQREYDARLAVLERPAGQGARLSAQAVVACADVGPVLLLALPFEVTAGDGRALEVFAGGLAGKPAVLICYAGGYAGYLPSGRPLDEDSAYEDVAARWGPDTRAAVWEGIGACIANFKRMKQT
jgi:hypothetical protein